MTAAEVAWLVAAGLMVGAGVALLIAFLRTPRRNA